MGTLRITVAGHNEYSLPPERATVHLTVDVEGPDRVATSEEATRLVSDISEELHGLRRRPATPPLTWYSVGPVVTRWWHPYNDRGEAMPPRYGASAQLRAKFSDFPAMADVLAGWAGRQSLRIDHVEWTLTDDTRASVEATALTRAVGQARARALAIAQAAGWQDVELQEVADPGLLSEPGGGEPVPVAMAMGFARRDAAGGGGGLVPEDVHGEARVHARFVATR